MRDETRRARKLSRAPDIRVARLDNRGPSVGRREKSIFPIERIWPLPLLATCTRGPKGRKYGSENIGLLVVTGGRGLIQTGPPSTKTEKW